MTTLNTIEEWKSAQQALGANDALLVPLITTLRADLSADVLARLLDAGELAGAPLRDAAANLRAVLQHFDVVAGQYLAERNAGRTVEGVRIAKLAALERARYAAQRDFTFAGNPIDLTEKAKTDILGAATGVIANPNAAPVTWVFGGGVTAVLQPNDVMALGYAAHARIQATYLRYAEIDAAIAEIAADDELSDEAKIEAIEALALDDWS